MIKIFVRKISAVKWENTNTFNGMIKIHSNNSNHRNWPGYIKRSLIQDKYKNAN
jgi:hypothetical protein